jgi:hypothetical protein
MGRPRKWKDDAERKRAERGTLTPPAPTLDEVVTAVPAVPASEGDIVVRDEEHTVEYPGEITGDFEGPASEELIDWEGKLWPVVRQRFVSEDEYAADEAEIAKHMIAHGVKDPDGKRVQRATNYARWRYRGWLAGEIRSL